MCEKVKYNDKIAAMLALARCKHSRKGKRRECRIYWCNECGGYHLTKQPKRDDNTDCNLPVDGGVRGRNDCGDYSLERSSSTLSAGTVGCSETSRT